MCAIKGKIWTFQIQSSDLISSFLIWTHRTAWPLFLLLQTIQFFMLHSKLKLFSPNSSSPIVSSTSPPFRLPHRFVLVSGLDSLPLWSNSVFLFLHPANLFGLLLFISGSFLGVVLNRAVSRGAKWNLSQSQPCRFVHLLDHSTLWLSSPSKFCPAVLNPTVSSWDDAISPLDYDDYWFLFVQMLLSTHPSLRRTLMTIWTPKVCLQIRDMVARW